MVEDDLAGPQTWRHLDHDFERVDVIVHAHVFAVGDAARGRVRHAHVGHRFAALLMQHRGGVAPRRVDAPARVPAGEQKRVFAAGRRRVLVGRQHLAHFLVQFLVEVELDTP